VVGETPIEGTTKIGVIVASAVAVGLVVAGAFLVSDRWSVRLSRGLGRVWAATLRLLRRPEPADLPQRLLEARASAIDKLRERWHIAAWSTLLTAFVKFALLLLCIRLCGVSEDVLSWSQVFVAFGIVNGLTVLPITPGDTGVSEVALIGMLGAAAGGGDVINLITAGVFLYRLLTWLLIMPVGWVTLLAWQVGLRRRAS
jgi:putative heme transporter